MDKQNEVLQLLHKQGLMPLFFDTDEIASLAIMEALYAGGVRLIEYTNRGATALRNFAAMKTAAEKCPDLYLGAGTIRDAASAVAFINAGADFLVSPALITEVHQVAATRNVLWIPGCMTPTEIAAAEKLAIRLVKLFPGNLLGPSFVQSVKEVFPALQFMPTGGVDATPANLKAWFDAGVCAVGMGSKLITASLIKDKDYNSLTMEVAAVLQRIDTIKSRTL